MGVKIDLQLKLASFAQRGRWHNNLITIISAPLFRILIISGIIRLMYYSVLLNTQSYDTAGYLNFHANILKGETESLRTPVYPYFIKLIGLFGQENLIDHIVAAQIVISFLSIILFYQVVKAFYKNSRVIFAASILYGGMLPVINFDKLVLTESFAVIFSLLFIYMMVNYLQKPAHIKAWVITLFTFIAVMLRPSFIYLPVLITVFWVLRLTISKRDRKICLSGLAASVVVILLIAGYSNLNETNNGFNGISVVSNHNEMAVIVEAGIYMNGDDPEISETIKGNLKLQQKGPGNAVQTIDINPRFGPDRVHKFIVNCIKNQPIAYMWHIASKLNDLQTSNIFTNYATHKPGILAFRVENIEYLVFCVTFNILYFLIVFDLIVIISMRIRRRLTPWFKIVLWLLIVFPLAVAIMGGYNEYQRLILPAMPALIILLFSYIDWICFATNINKLRSYRASV